MDNDVKERRFRVCGGAAVVELVQAVNGFGLDLRTAFRLACDAAGWDQPQPLISESLEVAHA